jgi:hypothetical protein
MLSLVQLIITFFSGYVVLRSLLIRWYAWELLAASYIVGVLLTTWLNFLCSLAVGYTFGLPMAWGVSLVLSTCSAIVLQLKQTTIEQPQKTTPILLDRVQTSLLALLKLPQFSSFSTKIQTSLVALFVVSWTVIFGTVFAHHSFAQGADGWYSGSNTWGDLALHSTLIYHFAESSAPDLEFPIYPEAKLTYPFLFDFYTATLLRTGMPIQQALQVTSTLTAVAVLILCFSALFRLTQSTWIAISGATLFVANSNSGTWHFFTDWQDSGLPLQRFLAQIPHNYVHLEERGLYWAQVFTDLLLPQRGILVGMAVFFICIILLSTLLKKNTFFTSASSDSDKKKLVHLQAAHATIIRYLFAFLVGAVPLFHIHSFLVLGGVFSWYLLQNWLTHKQTLSEICLDWVGPTLVIAAVALPQLFWQFSETPTEGFVQVKFGWLNKSESLLIFWVQNLGLQFFTTLIGAYYLVQKKKEFPLFVSIVVPLLALFLTCNIFIFQPNAWDNTKFMVYSHWAMIALSMFGLHVLWQWAKTRSLLHKASVCIGIGAVVIGLASGGVVSMLREYQLDWQIAATKDLAVASWVREYTPANAVFLTGSAHNHPIPMLTGRTIVMGYPGWLWTYGIDYATTEQEVLQIYRGAQTAQDLLAKHAIDYIYLGSQEREELRANQTFLQQFRVVYTNDGTTIYQVDRERIVK